MTVSGAKDWQRQTWRHFRMDIPGDWEMIRFGRSSVRGTCVFADRHDQRFDLSWTKVDSVPDLERMASDYGSKMRAARDWDEVREFTRKGWRGVVAKNGRGGLSRFVHHFPAEQCVIECVFYWPDGRIEGLEGSVLDSVQVELPAKDGEEWVRTWRAFGTEMRPVEGMALLECEAQPARVRFRFAPEHKPRGAYEEYERLGMVSEWLRGGVDGWLMAKLPAGWRASPAQMESQARHDVWCVHGSIPGASAWKLAQKRRSFSASAWICPHDERLFYGIQVGALSGQPDTRPVFARKLRCCAGAGGMA